MRERKTVQVEILRLRINERIAAEGTNMAGREALCSLLGDILMDADRYRGFRYIGGWKGVEEYRHYYY